MRSHWFDSATRAINEAVAKLPADATKQQIAAAVDAAYPFGPRSHHPYKQWLAARKSVLGALYPQHFKIQPNPAGEAGSLFHPEQP